MDLGLTDRACIVTGGSRGIGLQVARQLVAEGARVLLVGRGEQALKAAAEHCQGDARTVSWLALDVTEPDAGERAWPPAASASRPSTCSSTAPA